MSTNFKKILSEQSLSGPKTKSVINAIKNRNPITFYYSGPKKPEKISVKPGVRIRAEAVALGLSKGGNLIVRAYVQPPSVSKKGYNKTNWRTFRIDRMSNINVLENEVFDIKRPGYKEGSESSNGPMVKTYVTTDWTETPNVKPKETPPPVEPEVKPKDETLPQPKKPEKPSPLPEPSVNNVEDVYKTLNVIDVDGNKIITTQNYRDAVTDLYKRKESDWKKTQQELGKNTSPGEGTRKRFDIESNKELSDMLKQNNVLVMDEIPEPSPDTEELQETISRIKTLMLLIN